MDLLNDLFRSAPWSALRTGLHIAFVLSILYLLKQMLDLRRVVNLRHLAKPRPWLGVVVVGLGLALSAILVYQATWQLGGTSRPRFVAFMQLHDRRQFNPVHWIQRGRILDHRGQVLAASREVQGSVQRIYPDGPVFAHAVGYAHPRYGTAGIEAVANVHLNGGTPNSLGAWGELGRQLLTQDKRLRGQDLTLALDADLQRLAVQRLQAAGNGRGAVVMLRPSDGALRVLASTPAFDPNRLDADLFRRGDPATPLLNRATHGQYPPGSTFKVVIAAQALEAGFRGRLDCPAEGYTTSARYRPIRDHEYYSARSSGRRWAGHGRLDLATALAKSSNVFFAQLGVTYGHAALHTAGQRFLFNRQVSLADSLSGALTMQTGRLPKIPERDRYGLAQASIGQGKVLATPAHLALIMAAVANDGVAMQPRLMTTDAPRPLARIMSSGTAAQLAALLRQAVSDGTGRGIDTDQLAIAGKTGTAENTFGESHSWFIGFAPAHRPALAVAVLVEQGGYGSAVAAPIARDLLLAAREQGLL